MNDVVNWNWRLPARTAPVVSLNLPKNTLVITGGGCIAFQGDLVELRKLHTALGAELVLADVAQQVKP